MVFTVEELNLAHDDTVSKFKDFYYNIFIKCFKADELGDFEDYIYIKQNENEDYYYGIDFIDDGNRYVACFIYQTFPKLRTMIGEFACVDAKYRRMGLASKLMHRVIVPENFDWVVSEIEKDNTFNKQTWKRYGFKQIPVNYVQLPLRKGHSKVYNLDLCALSLHNQKYIPADVLDKTIWSYYRYSQYYADPSNLKEYLDFHAQCSKTNEFMLQEIK